MHNVNCNLCGVDDTGFVAAQNGYRVVRCNRCGLVYLNPRPASGTIIQMYSDYHQRGGKDEHTWTRLMDGNFRAVSALLDRTFPLKGKVLDIGCGYGHFVGRMQDAGWAATGIEPSAAPAAYAKRNGLDIMETTIDAVELPAGSFEAVTAFYVLEHLPDPAQALKKIFALLKPGGMLVLRVPHTTPVVKLLALFKIRNNLYDLPFHLYDFSPETITALLEKTGFSSSRVIPGMPTLPDRLAEKMISIIFGNLSRLLFAASFGMILLPGTSKTVIAVRPEETAL